MRQNLFIVLMILGAGLFGGCRNRAPLPEADALAKMTPAQRGETYFNYYCAGCHSNDPQVTRSGPSGIGMWGRNVTHTDGSVAAVDRNYLATKIRGNESRREKGYDSLLIPKMPPRPLTDPQIDDLVAYLQTLKP